MAVGRGRWGQVQLWGPAVICAAQAVSCGSSEGRPRTQAAWVRILVPLLPGFVPDTGFIS